LLSFVKSFLVNKIIINILFLILINIQTLFATADGPDSWKVVGVDRNEMLNIRNNPNHTSKQKEALIKNIDGVT